MQNRWGDLRILVGALALALLAACASGELIIDEERLYTCSRSEPNGTCPEGEVCVSGVCEAVNCTNRVRDANESDIDCGGACPGCLPDQLCNVGDDCESRVCADATKVCVAPACDDGVQNQTETDIDCGGTCVSLSTPQRCGDGAGCELNADCASRICTGGICAASLCDDNEKNGEETAIDCGGSVCDPCPEGEVCVRDRDCTTGVCRSSTCQPPTCQDLTKNGSETGLDCGGPDCPNCPRGQGCESRADCQSGVCDVDDTGLCLDPTCTDGVRNQTETDIDCGGACRAASPPSLCDESERCLDNADCSTGVCQAGYCRASGCAGSCGGVCGPCTQGGPCNTAQDCYSLKCVGDICQAPTCSDGILNGEPGTHVETGIDCGGDCPDCGTGEGCQSPDDCVTGICTNNECVAPTCNNDQIDGTCDDGVTACTDATPCGGGQCILETDVDCGGSCPDCGVGQGCNDAQDCTTRVCDPTDKVCVQAGCSDDVKNGDETDVDCGGGTCPACLTGDDCLTDDDCASQKCESGTCQGASCNDGLLNGSETDIDCGGPSPSCPRCGNSKTCEINSDCASVSCVDNACAGSACTNNQLDSGAPTFETDVDCGGPTCPKCANGDDCILDRDCVGGACDQGTCETPFSITSVQTERANRAEGIRAVATGSGFATEAGDPDVTVYLLLSTACGSSPGSTTCRDGTTDGTDKLTLDACSGQVNCSATPSLLCYSADAAGTQLVINACPGAVADLTQGFYDLRVEKSSITASAALGRAMLFASDPAPRVLSVSPETAFAGAATDGLISDASVEIIGRNFTDTPLVELIDINNPTSVYFATNVEWFDDGGGVTRLQAIVPSETQSMPIGSYWVRVTNPDGQSAYWLIDLGDGAFGRGQFRVRDIPGPRVSSLDPARPNQGLFPVGMVIAGQNFVAPDTSGVTPTGGSVAYMLFPDGEECALTTVGLTCGDYDACQDATAGETVTFLGAYIDESTLCLTETGQSRNLSAGHIRPIKVANPDGQFYVYFSLRVYANSDGKLDAWFPEEALTTPRAFMGGAVGFDDLRSTYLYVAGGATCAGTGCPLRADDWDTDGSLVLLDSVEFSRVSPFGQLNPWDTLSNTDPEDSDGGRIPNVLNIPRAGLDLVRLGRWYFAIGGRVDTDDGMPSSPTIERARILGLESRPGVQWAQRTGPGSLPAGIYHYQIAAISSNGEGLGSREVTAVLDDAGEITVQWEAWTDPWGDGSTPTSYAVYRSLETIGRQNTGQRLAYLYRPAAAECLRRDGSNTGVTGCIQFVDDGMDANVITPSILSATTVAGTGLSADTYTYRLAAYTTGATDVSVAGYDWNVTLAATSDYQLTWEHNGAAAGYYVYRDGACVGNVDAGSLDAGDPVTFLDDDSGATCGADGVPPERLRPIERGQLTLWKVIGDTDGDGDVDDTRFNLRTGREGHKALALSLDDPANEGKQRHFIYVVGGRHRAPNGSGSDAFDYLMSSERVEVSLKTGEFVQVSEYSSEERYWDYERPVVTTPGDCDQGSPTNCIEMATGRAYHSLTTTYGRFANEQPDLPTDPDDPCPIPDGDGDGFNNIECGGQDCDDTDPDIYPGAPEICDDGIDSNCDGCDENVVPNTCCDCTEPAFADQDGDGFTSISCCYQLDQVCSPDDANAGDNFNMRNCDCDDSDPNIFPGATEICGNGVVEDCYRCATEGDHCGTVTDPDNCDTATSSNTTLKCADCDEVDNCNYDCSSGDPTCSGSCDPATLASMDADGDGYESDAYADPSHPLNSCCSEPGVTCTDCNDSRADINPGAAEICGNGIDENCDGIDPPCTTCQDFDGDGHFDYTCGGNDCVDNLSQLCAVYGPDGTGIINPCDPTVCTDCGTKGTCGECATLLTKASQINPSVVGDSAFGTLCGNGIDDDCADGDAICVEGLTVGPPLEEPIYIIAHMGAAGWDDSGNGNDQDETITGFPASTSAESVVIETEEASSLGHFVWVDSCTDATEGKLYNTSTCGVRGWEYDEIASYGGLHGQESLTYYDYAFQHGGTGVGSKGSQSNPARFPMCVVPGEFPSNPADTNNDCVTATTTDWDMDEELICGSGGDNACSQSAGANMGNPSQGRAFFVMERMFSFLFAIGGVSGSSWAPLDTVEVAGQ